MSKKYIHIYRTQNEKETKLKFHSTFVNGKDSVAKNVPLDNELISISDVY
jgi:hypothetical protein